MLRWYDTFSHELTGIKYVDVVCLHPGAQTLLEQGVRVTLEGVHEIRPGVMVGLCGVVRCGVEQGYKNETEVRKSTVPCLHCFLPQVTTANTHTHTLSLSPPTTPYLLRVSMPQTHFGPSPPLLGRRSLEAQFQ